MHNTDKDDWNTMTNYDSVVEFHRAFHTEDSLPGIADKLVHEESVELLKELVDLVYVLLGRIYSTRLKTGYQNTDGDFSRIDKVIEFCENMGWDFHEAFDRVHEANMSKLGEDGKPVYREDGKVLKGPNYKPANLEDLV